MKPIEGYEKLRGGYYTPRKIAEYITEWAVRTETNTVLEPSCGDGVFIETICNKLRKLGCEETAISNQVLGVELDPTEMSKAAQNSATVINQDFFTYYRSSNALYDVVVGNPPFIRDQSFNENFRKVAFELMKENGFHPNRLTNIWLPFLILSCLALKDDGRIGMVIPAELFQVDYAAETRKKGI
jgi:adenine-specific DNA-methyltransferase